MLSLKTFQPAAKQALDAGLKLAEEGKTEAAIENMRKAIQIFPDYFDAHLQLGNVFLKADQLQRRDRRARSGAADQSQRRARLSIVWFVADEAEKLCGRGGGVC